MKCKLMLGVAGMCALALIVAPIQASPVSEAKRIAAHDGAKRQVTPWYVSAAAIHRVSLKPNTRFWKFEHLALGRADAERQLREWKAEGIDVIEVFAPEEGGNSYDGLDAKNRYALDPGLGTIEDFRLLVGQAHALKLSVVTFQNLGYAAVDASQFVKAEDDIRAGKTTRESQLFFWSDNADAPAPAKGNSYFFVRPNKPGYDPKKSEFWQWSDRAGRFFWTRWPGKDANGATTHLPQYNWASPAWQEEAAKVVRFWMNTGLDGMIVDAVNWYPGYDWNKNAALLAEMRRSPGAKLMVPEGGGAFHTDDPVGWIQDGAWTGLYDYGLDIWWEKGAGRPMLESIKSSNPDLFEEALRSYHDRVVAAGGVLIQPVLDIGDAGMQRLEEGLLATSGDMLCFCGPAAVENHPAAGVSDLLKLKAEHPAFFQNSTRRRIATNDDKKLYATLRESADRSERLLAVFNFSSEAVTAEVDTGAIKGSGYRDLESGAQSAANSGTLSFELAGYGHRIFRVEP